MNCVEEMCIELSYTCRVGGIAGARIIGAMQHCWVKLYDAADATVAQHVLSKASTCGRHSGSARRAKVV
jgi:hypothetical protein